MKKALSLILTICMVFVGVVSFSIPVNASPDWSLAYNPSSGSVNCSNNNPTYHFLSDGSWTGANPSFYLRPESNGAYSGSASSSSISWYQHTYWYRICQLNSVSPNVGERSYKVENLSVSSTSSSRSLMFFIGTVADVVNGTCTSIPFGSSGIYFWKSSDYVYLWGRIQVYSSSTPSDFSETATYSHDGVYSRVYGTADSINSSIDAIGQDTVDAIKKQTDDVTNGYDNSSMSGDNTRLNNQIDQYDQAQEETSNKSTAYIDGAEFVNPFSNATVLASVTFATSFLQSLFMNLDIWQLVVTVSLCLVLALMLVGWFKFRGD